MGDSIFFIIIMIFILIKVIYYCSSDTYNINLEKEDERKKDDDNEKVLSFFKCFISIIKKCSDRPLNATIRLKVSFVQSKAYVECSSFVVWKSPVFDKSIFENINPIYNVKVDEDPMLTKMAGELYWDITYLNAKKMSYNLFHEMMERLNWYGNIKITQPWTDFGDTAWGLIELEL